MVDPESIYHWHRLDDRIVTSGQPSETQLADIAALGVRYVINLGLHSHEKALPDEAVTVDALGMTYVHIPVDFKNPTERDFEYVLHSTQRRVTVRCTCTALPITACRPSSIDTYSRARGQSYYAVRSFPAPFEPQSFWRWRQFAPVAVRLQTERSARSPSASPSASSLSLSASSRALVEPARPSRIARSSSFRRLQAPKAQAPFRYRTALRHRPLQDDLPVPATAQSTRSEAASEPARIERGAGGAPFSRQVAEERWVKLDFYWCSLANEVTGRFTPHCFNGGLH
jgi:protein tyrosine phosphatase (PTP) superfamily phosphohydrolase (DUF442 family)